MAGEDKIAIIMSTKKCRDGFFLCVRRLRVCDNVRECFIFDFAFNGIRFEIVMRVSAIATRFRWKYEFYGAKTATTVTNKYILEIIFKSNSTILFSNLNTWVWRWRRPTHIHQRPNEFPMMKCVCIGRGVATLNQRAAQTWKYCSDWEVIIIYYYYCQNEGNQQTHDPPADC